MNNGTCAKETILKLKEIFSTFGIPFELVSDNGPPFNSSEFIAFCQANAIKPIKSPPYHPQSNGSAERAVQTVKKGLEKSLLCNAGEIVSNNLKQSKLANFLFTYRNTPSTVTGLSPAEIIFKYRPRTRFDLLKPSCYIRQNKTNENLDKKNVTLFKLNDNVYVKNMLTRLWEKGKIVKVISFCTYLVSVNNHIRFVHANSIRNNIYADQPVVSEATSESVHNNDCAIVPNVIEQSPVTCTVPETTEVSVPTMQEPKQEDKGNSIITTRSGRIVKPPNRLNL